MARNHYEDAAGVLALEWKRGEPPKYDFQPVICEVWYADLRIEEHNDHTGTRPYMQVQSRIEFRVWTSESGWRVISYKGELIDPKSLGNGREGVVRRHAPPTMRYWTGNITLDGWGK